MDEEINSNNTNSSLITDELDFTYSNNNILFLTVVLCYFLGLFSNSIFIYLFVKAKKLQNRRNLVVLHWCIGHVICLLSFMFLACVIPNDCHSLIMFILYVDIIQLFNQVFLMITLITHPIITSNVSINLIVLILDGIAATLILIDLILGITIMRIIFGCFILLGIVYGCIAVIVKHINKFRRRETTPMSNESTLKLYLATLYVFTWKIYLIFFIMGIHWAFLLLVPFFHITPIFVMIILIMKDSYFKRCFIQLFRCQSIDSDGSVYNADECNDNDGNDVRSTHVRQGEVAEP